MHLRLVAIPALLACTTWPAFGAELREFFTEPTIVEAKVSPGGELIALRGTRQGKRAVVIVDREMKAVAGFPVPPRVTLNNWTWTADQRIVFESISNVRPRARMALLAMISWKNGVDLPVVIASVAKQLSGGRGIMPMRNESASL